MNVRYVLFDLDGTLFDTSPGIKRCVRAALAAFGYEAGDLNRFIGPPFLDALTEFCGLSREQALRVKDEYRRLYGAGGVDECAPMPGAEQCLQALRAAGLTPAVATSKPRPFAMRVLERFGFEKYFACIAADDTPTGTGKAEVVAAALRALGDPPPQACVMVGDRKYDVLGAAAHGIRCICYASGFAAAGEYEAAGAWKVVTDFAGVRDAVLSLR